MSRTGAEYSTIPTTYPRPARPRSGVERVDMYDTNSGVGAVAGQPPGRVPMIFVGRQAGQLVVVDAEQSAQHLAVVFAEARRGPREASGRLATEHDGKCADAMRAGDRRGRLPRRSRGRRAADCGRRSARRRRPRPARPRTTAPAPPRRSRAARTMRPVRRRRARADSRSSTRRSVVAQTYVVDQFDERLPLRVGLDTHRHRAHRAFGSIGDGVDALRRDAVVVVAVP